MKNPSRVCTAIFAAFLVILAYGFVAVYQKAKAYEADWNANNPPHSAFDD